jgi:hypothetical protein
MELAGLHNIIESKPLDIGPTFLQWLRLLVIHQVAIDRLLSLDLSPPLSIAVLDSMNMRNTMEDWKKTIQDTADRSHLANLDKIIESLAKSMGSVPQPSAFLGTYHCEAILASLMRLKKCPFGVSNEVFSKVKVRLLISNFSYVQMSNELQKCSRYYIGVSKPSCPVCIQLLYLLRGQEDCLAVWAAHSMVSACALPHWLPIDIIREMVRFFEAKLVQILPSLCREPRQRCDSLQSLPFSASDMSHAVDEEFYEREEFYDLEDIVGWNLGS